MARPRGDLLTPVPPEQIDEEGDCQQEGDPSEYEERRQRDVEVEHHDDERDQRDDQEAA